MAKIEVSRLKPLSGGSGSVKAFCSVHLGGKLTINDVKVIQDGHKAPWVSMPSRQGQDKDGKMKYFPQVWVDDEDLRKQIEEAVLAAWGEAGGSLPPDEDLFHG